MLIPPEFRTWRAVPASHIVDDMMRYLGHVYYVGYLSAAEIHDAAHQRPQTFQVVTDERLKTRTFGRVRVKFILNSHTADRPTVTVNTPTGTMGVSTPEATILDLGSRPKSLPCGTTTGSMASMAKSKLSVSLDPDRLARAQELVHAASVSELLDTALIRMIEQETERRHIEGYLRIPADNEFAQWAVASRSNDDDEVDWAALYGLKR